MSRLLLDTCVLIDWAVDPKRLREEARIAIADGRAHVFVSAASAWEISLQRWLGKLRAPNDLSALLKANRFLELAITVPHTELAAELPWRHKDSFDRLLIAQAQAEQLTIVTRDEVFGRYEVPVMSA